MAIAIDASTPAIATHNGTTSVTSASFTPPAGALLVATLGQTVNNDVTMSNSATAFTWTSRVDNAAPSSGRIRVFTAPATVSQSMTVTASYAGTEGGGMKIWVLTGADTASVGNSGTGDSTTNNLTATGYTSSADESWGFAVAVDLNFLGTPTSTDTSGGTWNFSSVSSGISLRKATSTATSGSTVSFNYDAAGASAAGWVWGALEILATATPVRGRLVSGNQAVNRSYSW